MLSSLSFFFFLQSVTVTDEELELLDEIIEKDPLSDLSEQDKSLLWKLR